MDVQFCNPCNSFSLKYLYMSFIFCTFAPSLAQNNNKTKTAMKVHSLSRILEYNVNYRLEDFELPEEFMDALYELYTKTHKQETAGCSSESFIDVLDEVFYLLTIIYRDNEAEERINWYLAKRLSLYPVYQNSNSVPEDYCDVEYDAQYHIWCDYISHYIFTYVWLFLRVQKNLSRTLKYFHIGLEGEISVYDDYFDLFKSYVENDARLKVPDNYIFKFEKPLTHIYADWLGHAPAEEMKEATDDYNYATIRRILRRYDPDSQKQLLTEVRDCFLESYPDEAFRNKVDPTVSYYTRRVTDHELDELFDELEELIGTSETKNQDVSQEPLATEIDQVIRQINKGNIPARYNWEDLLKQMLRVQALLPDGCPYYMLIQFFLRNIISPGVRSNVVSMLQDAAPKCLPDVEAEKFITDGSCLYNIYVRLNNLGLAYGEYEKIWPNDPELNELAMLMQHIEPRELVAISQAIMEDNKVIGVRGNIIPHILCHSKFYGKRISKSGFDFCWALYFAEGHRELLMSGKENYMEFPTFDAFDHKFMNECYSLYIEREVEYYKKEWAKTKPGLHKESDYYLEVCSDLNADYRIFFEEGHFETDNKKIYGAIKARFSDLMGLVVGKYNDALKKEEEEEKHVDYNGKKFAYILSEDPDEIEKIHKRIEVHLDPNKPSLLRDELYALHIENAIRLPMNKPSEIIREVKKIWGKLAPEERSFVTTWGRLKTN